MRLVELKGGRIDKNVMNKRKSNTEINAKDIVNEGKIKKNLKIEKTEWVVFINKDQREREKYLIDLYCGSYDEQSDEDDKKQKQIAKKLAKTEKRNNEFKYVT